MKETITQQLRNGVRRLWYERPDPSFRQWLLETAGERSFAEDAATFVRDGIVLLPGYFSGARLDAMRSEFGQVVARTPENEKAAINITREALRPSEIFSTAAVDAHLVRLAAFYWGKPVFLSEWSAKRLMPCPPEDYGAYQYHHDCKNKQVKAMILLTSVTASGQRMDYIRGTHRELRQFTAYGDTRFDDADALRYGAPLQCTGPAGTVMVFDTNGLHRGHRNMGPVRDTITMNFTAGHARYVSDSLHPAAVGTLGADSRKVLRLRPPRAGFILERL